MSSLVCVLLIADILADALCSYEMGIEHWAKVRVSSLYGLYGCRDRELTMWAADENVQLQLPYALPPWDQPRHGSAVLSACCLSFRASQLRAPW